CKYRLTEYSADHEEDLSKLLSNWKPQVTVPQWSGVDASFSYPETACFDDRLLLFGRDGVAERGNYTITIFYDDAWQEMKHLIYPDNKSIYAKPYKIDDRVYVGFMEHSQSANYNVSLIITDDKGETWKHWNGTLTPTPILADEATVIKTQNQGILGIWNDEEGRTNILYKKLATREPWYRNLSTSIVIPHLAVSNGTAPSPNLTWRNSALSDENGDTIYGTGTGFLDKEYNQTTLWVSPWREGYTTKFIVKYLPLQNETFKFRMCCSFNDTAAYKSSFIHVFDYSMPYECVSMNTIFQGILGLEEELENQGTFPSSRMRLFRFTARKDANATHIISLINCSSADHTRYTAYIYNSSWHLLACKRDGVAGSYGTPPRHSWNTFPLNKAVEIKEGRIYWLGFTLAATDQYYVYSNLTSSTALQCTQTWPTPYSYIGGIPKTYFNQTASIFLGSAKTVFWGLWKHASDDSGRTIYVPDNYTTIQAAINAANEGDTVFVSSGMYYENVIANKTVSLVGENSHSTIIDGGGVGNVIHVRANNVSIHRLTIRNSGSEDPFAGIFLDSVIDSNVSFCNVTNNHYGMLLISSSRNSLSRNIVAMNYMGVKLWASWNNNTLSQNIITRNYNSGVGLSTQSDYNTLVNNTVSHSWLGIWMIRSSDNVIYHNNFVNITEIYSTYSVNVWDNGCEGNYWSNYNGSDLNEDGIGDDYLPWEGVDYYPLMSRYWNPCDINHDLKVEMKDVGIAARAFFTQPGDERWNCHADINGPEYLVPDYKVNMRDIGLIASNFGETYP
ncbi:hypothetical protein GTO27_00510, partial [Candidatus Bathyarchaeota archaeon]|nr:hypothetical protein [Candidatus Bathyarchaeota archaeon]